MALTEQEEFELLSLEREKAAVSNETPQTPETKQPEKMVGGVLGIGAIPESQYKDGERNLVGNVFERPGAAVRSALMGQGYEKGAVNPGEVPTFQASWLDNYYNSVGKQISNMPQGQQQVLSNLISIPGIAVSAAGLAADTMTNPADLLGMLVGKAPIKAAAGSNLAKTDIGVIASNVGKALPKYDSELTQAGKAKVALDTVRDTLGNAKKLAVDVIKNEPTALDFSGVSDKVLKAIHNPIYEIELDNSGAVKQTVGNLDKVKEAVGELIRTDKIWEESPSKELRIVKQFYGKVRNEMVKASEKEDVKNSIAPALDAYKSFMDKYTLINKRIVDTAGNAMGNKLKETFAAGAEPAYKEAFKEVAKTASTMGDPTIQKVIDSMKNRKLLKDLLRLSGKAAIGSAVLGGAKFGIQKLLGD